MSRDTVKIEVCDCGRPGQVGVACRSCGRSALPALRALPALPDAAPVVPTRGNTRFSRSRILRAVIIAPLLASLLIWSTLTPAVLVRAASLAICVALVILIVWPSHDQIDR